VLFVDRSTCIGLGAGALICPVGSALRSNRAEV
jgi:NAD-dependent dihydropyrimidine dehydrogenase PreA subunit